MGIAKCGNVEISKGELAKRLPSFTAVVAAWRGKVASRQVIVVKLSFHLCLN